MNKLFIVKLNHDFAGKDTHLHHSRKIKGIYYLTEIHTKYCIKLPIYGLSDKLATQHCFEYNSVLPALRTQLKRCIVPGADKSTSSLFSLFYQRLNN